MANRITAGARKKFGGTREVLEEKPVLQYLEPDQLRVPQQPLPAPEPSIANRIARTDAAISAYADIAVLAEAAQVRLDQRAAGFKVHLDPKVDAQVIRALRQRFPERADHTYISYEDYRACLENLNKASLAKVQTVTSENLKAARASPLKTNFMGWDKLPGLNRPEVDPASQMIEPPDLDALQQSQLKELFGMMKPDITDLIKNVAGL